MTAAELRIGNLVSEIVLGISKIVGIHEDAAGLSNGDDTGVYSINYENISPIPLTPDILEKAGFIKDTQWWGDGVEYYHKHTDDHHDITSIDIMFGFESDEKFLNGVNYGQTNFGAYQAPPPTPKPLLCFNWRSPVY